MIKSIAVICILFCVYTTVAQISIDSLRLELSSSFVNVGTRDYLMEEFTSYKSEEKKERYDIYQDSLGNLKEYIGLSIVHYAFDDQDRIVLIEGFNSQGIRSYWDFPDVSKYRYVNDTLISEMTKIRNKICGCSVYDKLYDVKIINEINRNRTYQVYRYSIYTQDSLMKLTFAKTTDGKFYGPDKAVYIFREFDSEKKQLIIQERYFDSSLKPIMGEHMVYPSEGMAFHAPISYAWSVRTFEKNSLDVVQFYNARGKLIMTKNYGDVRGPG